MWREPGYSAGNPKTAEVGLKGNARRLSWQIAAYRTEFDDLIVLDPTTFVPFNVAEATAEGGEASVRYELAGWRLELGAGYVRATNDATGQQLQRPVPSGTVAWGPVRISVAWMSISNWSGDQAPRTIQRICQVTS
ncbi:hypothetical protein CF392_16270 [Tamilnaduibacter salinus]|uniref:TonB-dependent receptor-like beta-barrel domain-containing protein n=1 Tax=Tamilnaduibacter salinus TaxID=1484056 RepID=A0A2A2HYV9_9GAMM|nr:hypothetical protein CF392_16270 [Tamilnaduibacter salinus]